MRFDFFPISHQLDLSKNKNIQIKFGSRPMASLCELLCYLSLLITDPLLRNCFLTSLPDFLPTFLIILHLKVLIMNESDELTVQFLLFNPTIQYTSPKTLHSSSFSILLLYLCNPQIFYHKDRHKTIYKNHWPKTLDDLRLPLASYSRSQKPPNSANFFS